MASYKPSLEEKNAYGNIAAICWFEDSVLKGISLAAVVYLTLSSTLAFFHAPKDERKGRGRFIIIGWIILTSYSISIGLDIRQYFQLLYEGGPTGFSYIETIRNHAPPLAFDLISSSAYTVNLAIADTLLLWRSFVMWRDKPWPVAFPLLTCIGAIGCSMALTIRTKPQAAMDAKADWELSNLLMAYVALSVAMNIMVTLLILVPLTITKARVRKSMGGRSQRMYTNVTAILVESSVPLTLCGVCWVVLRAISLKYPVDGQILIRGRLNTFDTLFSTLYLGFVALSPLMIINRVTKRRSWSDADGSRGAAGAGFSQSICFAVHSRSMAETNERSHSQA